LNEIPKFTLTEYSIVLGLFPISDTVVELMTTLVPSVCSDGTLASNTSKNSLVRLRLDFSTMTVERSIISDARFDGTMKGALAQGIYIPDASGNIDQFWIGSTYSDYMGIATSLEFGLISE
jgi:hypothetical protein